MNLPIQKKLDIVSDALGLRSAETTTEGSFPEAAANELARAEAFNKHLYRPNTYLHKWWARRCGTTFRFILKQFAEPPYKKDYYEPGGLEGKIVLDPMMGGGTTLHEAIRMGANVIGSDIDPIPVLQAEASLARASKKHKENIFIEFFSELRNRLKPFFATNCPICKRSAEIKFVLYGLTRKCNCGESLFVDSLTLRRENYGDIMICPVCKNITERGDHNCTPMGDGRPLLTKGQKKCPQCGGKYEEIADVPLTDRYKPLFIATICDEHGLRLKTVDDEDIKTNEKARVAADKLDFGDPGNFRIPDGPKSKDLINRNVKSFLDLYTPRQKLYIYYSKKLLEGLGLQERLWVSLLVSTSLEFNSILCGYKGTEKRRPGAVRHVFSHHAYSFPHTALENNPISSKPSSGTLMRLFHDRILRAADWSAAPVERRFVNVQKHKITIKGEIDGGTNVSSFDELKTDTNKFLLWQRDSRELDLPPNSVDLVVTDPPYFDSVQYSDLSNFFRVWLRFFLPNRANWDYDPSASAVFEGSTGKGDKYGEILSGIWSECNRVLKKGTGRLAFTYHHWSPDAWAELTVSLRNAGFVLSNRYVVFSENPISVHIRDLKALKHDVVLILEPKNRSIIEQGTPWIKPERISINDSYEFCADCGAALGWVLATPSLNENEIRDFWESLI
jgi:putative DNA methylase